MGQQSYSTAYQTWIGSAIKIFRQSSVDLLMSYICMLSLFLVTDVVSSSLRSLTYFEQAATIVFATSSVSFGKQVEP